MLDEHLDALALIHITKEGANCVRFCVHRVEPLCDQIAGKDRMPAEIFWNLVRAKIWLMRSTKNRRCSGSVLSAAAMKHTQTRAWDPI